MMNKQDILRKIGGIINELHEQHEYLSQADKLNILELELFTAHADFLIDHIEILKKLNDKAMPDAPAANYQPPVSAPFIAPTKEQEVPKSIQQEEESKDDISFSEAIIPRVEEEPEQEERAQPDVAKEEDPIVEQEEENEEDASAPSFKFDFSEEPKDMTFDFEKRIAAEEIFDRKLSRREQELIEEKQAAKEKPEQRVNEEETEDVPEPVKIETTAAQEEPAKVKAFHPSAPLAPSTTHQHVAEEKPEATKPRSLNEILSERNAVRETSGRYPRALTDLKTAVSLNDKMIFIKELFNGYNLAYSEAIEILNRFDSYEAADNFLLKNYAEKNNWLAKQDVVDRFYDVLKRKFNKV